MNNSDKMRKLVLLVMFLLISSSIAVTVTSAKVPKKGDYVQIYVSDMYYFKGNITEIENGMICLNASDAYESGEQLASFIIPKNICVGIGSISFIEWVPSPEEFVAIMNKVIEASGNRSGKKLFTSIPLFRSTP